MTPFLRKLIGMNWLLFAAVVVISLAGVFFIQGATEHFTSEKTYWQDHARFVGFGLVIFLAVTLTDYRWVKWLAIPLYVVSMILLGLTFTKFGVEVKGAVCWLKLPGLPQFQPSQIAIVSGILVLALFLSQFPNLHAFWRLCGTGIITLPPMALTLLQKDNGMTLVWVPTVMAMLWLGGIPKRWLAALVLVGLTLLPLVICFKLEMYARSRIVAFLDPEIDPRGTGYAIIQSLIAVGSAGFNGKRMAEVPPGAEPMPTQLELGLIPADVAHTDYIFTTIAEQWGFLGGVAVIAAFGILLLAMVLTAFRARDAFGLLIVAGITGQVFFHTYQNIGMTIALMPITGLPLPLISSGGTFVLMLMFTFGLINSVWVHRNQAVSTKEKEFALA
ncbi:MAG: Rod shape-determining protein RodA [Verrucomicrobiota bacterium]|jgi:rod shape determining protein RodA